MSYLRTPEGQPVEETPEQTAALRREAAELLRLGRRRRDQRMRELLLRRRWYCA
jgi:hypothetical protein